MVDLIEKDVLPSVTLKNPIAAIKNVSQDQSYQWLVEVEGPSNRLVPSVEIQRMYLDLAKQEFAGQDGDTDWVLKAWET